MSRPERSTLRIPFCFGEIVPESRGWAGSALGFAAWGRSLELTKRLNDRIVDSRTRFVSSTASGPADRFAAGMGRISSHQ